MGEAGNDKVPNQTVNKFKNFLVYFDRCDEFRIE